MIRLKNIFKLFNVDWSVDTIYIYNHKHVTQRGPLSRP